MNKLFLLAVTQILLFSATLTFACDYPEHVKIPDGQTADKQAMLDGQKDVKTFMAAMETYLACIDKEEKDAIAKLENPDKDMLAQRKVLSDKKYDAAVDDMQLLAAKFNEQVRAFKAQTAPEPQ